MIKISRQYIYDVAKEILNVDSPTGYSKNVITLLKKYLDKLGYIYTTNLKGGLTVEILGVNNDYTKAISAHVDTLGLMVRSINADGTLNFTNLGGPILNTYDGEYCNIITRNNKIYRGTILSKSPSIHVFKDSTTRLRNEENMIVRIDEKVFNKQDVLDLGINNGDIIAIDPKVEISESGFIKSRFLDDKISVTLIIALLKYLKENDIKLKYNTQIYFSNYEEVGHGLAYLDSKVCELLSVDMGAIGLDLECSEYDVSICAKDSSGPYDYEMVSNLINLAKEANLSYVVDIYPMYSSDTSAALRGGNNIKGALIGPGVAASHGMERSHIEAVENTLKLLYLYLVK